jgi:hypothetical protein
MFRAAKMFWLKCVRLSPFAFLSCFEKKWLFLGGKKYCFWLGFGGKSFKEL